MIPREHGVATRRADRRPRMEVGQDRAVAGERIDRWRLKIRGIKKRDISPPEIVRDDQDDVWAVWHARRRPHE